MAGSSLEFCLAGRCITLTDQLHAAAFHRLVLYEPVLCVHKRNPLLADLYGDPAQEPGRAARFGSRAQAHDFRGYTAYI